MKVTNCPECDYPLQGNESQCPECGAPIAQESSLSSAENAVNEPRKGKDSRVIEYSIISIGAILILALVFIHFIFQMNKENSDKSNNEQIIASPAEETIDTSIKDDEKQEVEISSGLIEAMQKYDMVWEFSDGLAKVRIGDEENPKYGYINIEGKEVIPCRYYLAEDFFEGLAIVKKDGKWGFINTQGEEVVPCKYDFARDFSEGLAAVRIGDYEDGKWGFINTRGKEVISCKYDGVGDFHEGLAEVRKDGNYGYINTQGEVIITCKYDYIGNFHEGLAAVKIGDYEDGKWGFINAKGKEIIPCKFDGARDFSSGLAAVKKGDWENAKWGFINTKGEEVIPYKYRVYEDMYEEEITFSEGLAAVRSYDSNLWGFINTQGEEVISHKYDEACNFSNGLAAVKEGNWENGKWGFINTEGRKIVSCKYDQVGEVSEGMIAVKRNGKWGFVNTEGEEVISCKFDNYDEEAEQSDKPERIPKFSGGLALFIQRNGQCGFVDKKGNSTFTQSESKNEKVVDLDWIQGTWTRRVNILGKVLITKLIIEGKYITNYSDNEILYQGEYKIYDGALHFGATYIPIDEERHLLKCSDTEYYEHSSQPSNNVARGTSEAQNKEMKIMARLHKLSEEGKSFVNELASMRSYGFDPHRYLYIKQCLIQIKDEQIRLAWELNDSELAREYQQQKEQLLQAFRMMENSSPF